MGVILVVAATVGGVATVMFRPAGDQVGADQAAQSIALDGSPTSSASPSGDATPTPVSPTADAPVASAPPATSPAVVPARTTSRPPANPPANAPPPAGTDVASFEAQVLALVNVERATAGCPALTADSRLTDAARGHSADMAARNYFDHTTPEGVSFATRITNAGYQWSAAAENIASGQKDPAAVMKAWMNSPGHRANILNCAYRNLGVGLVYNARKTPYWTQDFGKLR